MVSVLLLQTAYLSDPGCYIAVREHDRISGIQVESALLRHKIRCVSGSMHGFGNMAIAAYCSPEQAAKILSAEAPKQQFSMHITGYRGFSEDTWPWSKAKTLSQIDGLFPTLKVASQLSKLSPSTKVNSLLQFRARKYIGLDFKSHTGLEVRIMSDENSETLQLL